MALFSRAILSYGEVLFHLVRLAGGLLFKWYFWPQPVQFYPDMFFHDCLCSYNFSRLQCIFFVFVVVVNEGNSECFVQNSREPWKGFNRGKIKNKISLSPLSFYDHLIAEMPTPQDLKFGNFVISIQCQSSLTKLITIKIHCIIHYPLTCSSIWRVPY